MEVADQIVLLILVKGLSGVNILIGHLSGVGVDVQRSRQACIQIYMIGEVLMYMNAQKRVCTLGVHVHIHVMCIYRRQQYCTHGIWNANIFYKKSNKMLYPYREGTVHYSWRFGATLMCGTISVYVTLVVLFVFIKATVMVMVRSIWVTS